MERKKIRQGLQNKIKLKKYENFNLKIQEWQVVKVILNRLGRGAKRKRWMKGFLGFFCCLVALFSFGVFCWLLWGVFCFRAFLVLGRLFFGVSFCLFFWVCLFWGFFCLWVVVLFFLPDNPARSVLPEFNFCTLVCFLGHLDVCHSVVLSLVLLLYHLSECCLVSFASKWTCKWIKAYSENLQVYKLLSSGYSSLHDFPPFPLLTLLSHYWKYYTTQKKKIKTPNMFTWLTALLLCIWCLKAFSQWCYFIFYGLVEWQRTGGMQN